MRAYLSGLAGQLLRPQGSGFPVHEAVLCSQRTSIIPLSLSTKILTPATIMSNSHPITTPASSSSNVQLIFNDALKAYKMRTKMDLLTHPLTAKLQDCNSPSQILAVLHQQVQGLDQSMGSDDRWSKWLDPTVNVLCMLSDTLGEGVSLVSPKT